MLCIPCLFDLILRWQVRYCLMFLWSTWMNKSLRVSAWSRVVSGRECNWSFRCCRCWLFLDNICGVYCYFRQPFHLEFSCTTGSHWRKFHLYKGNGIQFFVKILCFFHFPKNIRDIIWSFLPESLGKRWLPDDPWLIAGWRALKPQSRASGDDFFRSFVMYFNEKWRSRGKNNPKILWFLYIYIYILIRIYIYIIQY